MASENCFEKIIVLIDAENAQAGKADRILKDVSTYGRIVTKRAYANWTKPQVRPWESVVKKYAIGTVQQFDFASGKNASDMALTIDAMEQLFVGKYDCFAIISSDSDFTSLAMKLHESGVFVIGYGNRQTTESFRNACDEFNYVEDFPEENGVAAEAGTETAEGGRNGMTTGELDDLLRTASEKYGEADGFTNVSAAGSFIKRVHPDFSMKKFGYDKLPSYLTANGAYEVEKRRGKGGVTLVMYRLKHEGKRGGADMKKRTDPPVSPASENGEEAFDDALAEAWRRHADSDGFANAAAAGNFIRKKMKGVSARDFGYGKLSEYLDAKPEKFEVDKRSGGGGVTFVMYRPRIE